MRSYSFLLLTISFLASSLASGLNPHSAAQAPPPGSDMIFQRAELNASDGQSLGFLGSALAISGNTIVVGEPGYDDGMGNYVPGAAYVYVKTGSHWQNMMQVAKLNASDGGDCSWCQFAGAVGISGDTIVVGSDFSEAYVFVKPASGWVNMTETARLQGTPTTNCLCGGVAIDGDTIAVGSPVDSINAGSLSVFVKPQAGWQTTSQANAKLRESIQGYEDGLGRFVAISGGTIVSTGGVGNKSQGGVIVFVKPAKGWSGHLTQTATLTLTDPLVGPSSVSVSGGTVVSGVPDPYHELPYAEVWVKPRSGWTDMTETATLSDGSPKADNFGWSVVVAGNTILVGCPYRPLKQNRFRGLGFVFLKPASGWKTTAKYNAVLANSNWTNDDAFGTSVAISGRTEVVGAPNGPNQADVGAAYVFEK